MSAAHDFDPQSGFCRRCGIGEAWQDYRPACATPPPDAPPEAAGGPSTAPETPSPLDRAIARDPWDRIDGRFKR